MLDRNALAVAAKAAMEKRVTWGWTFGKQRRVMAIDHMMAEAAIRAYLDACTPMKPLSDDTEASNVARLTQGAV